MKNLISLAGFKTIYYKLLITRWRFYY